LGQDENVKQFLAENPTVSREQVACIFNHLITSVCI
jgi:hypothetical protein